MRREIKFRAWDKDEKIMHYEAERTYDYLTGKPQIMMTSFGDLLEDTNYVVEQYTGMKEVMGQDIYEGDLLLIAGWRRPRVVLFREGVFGIMTKASRMDDFLRRSHSYDVFRALRHLSLNKRVVGNIHENPELLEEVK